MSPAKRLDPLKRVAETRERKAARVLGESRQRLHAAQNKLEMLRQYRGEYRQRFETAAASGISAKQLLEYQGFLARLDQAIGAQEKAVTASHGERARPREHWQRKYTRSEALGKVRERCAKEETDQARAPGTEAQRPIRAARARARAGK